jgi:hypothetical protein
MGMDHHQLQNGLDWCPGDSGLRRLGDIDVGFGLGKIRVGVQ